MGPAYSIGVDFGTSSVRALVVDCGSGAEVGGAVFAYPSGNAGVVEDPDDPNLARQNPADHLEGFRTAVANAVAQAGVPARQIVGIGIDTTGSTPIPVDQCCTALAMLDRFTGHPAAQAWLWKDHTAHAEAAEITETAQRLGRPYLARCGGTYSSEWYWSKILRCARTAPEVLDASAGWIELCDWIPAQLTGVRRPEDVVRGACAAGHKAMYHTSWGGLPDDEFLSALDPRLAQVRASFRHPVATSAQPAGRLSSAYAEATGLHTGIPVAAGALDAHHGAIGAGIRPGTLVKIMGTSTCDIAVGREVPLIPGVCGVASGSVLPGLDAVEAGQSAVGDVFDWFVRCLGCSNHEDLTDAAARLKPGASGLLALDWHNGNRTVLVDPLLTGLVVGLTLRTTAPEIYRALIEATAFGARMIIERCVANGVPIEDVIICGGIAEKNPMAMQIYADVCNRPMNISPSTQTCALGAAIFGAVVGGAHPDTARAQAAMTAPPTRVYEPDPESARVYDELFELYGVLHDGFGLGAGRMDGVMKRLIWIRSRARAD